MQGWLIYRKKDSARNAHYIQFYEEACKKRNVQITLLYIENFSYGEDVQGPYLTYQGTVPQAPDFVVMRADVPEFSMHLEQMGYRVFNTARLSTIANDKYKTLTLAASLQLPVPKTRLAGKENAQKEAAALGYPLVMKPCDGHGGQDVLWVQNEADLLTALSTYHHHRFLLQKPVSDLGRDLRVYVLGGEPLCAMLRCSTEDFRSNYCLGGQASRYELSGKERAYVEAIAKALPIDFAGIDFMFHAGEPILNEIEDVVGARMLYALTDLKVVDLYVDYIIQSVQKGK